MTRAINDGTGAAPRLQPYLNLGTLDGLPEGTTAPRVQGAELIAVLQEAGFEGVQGADDATSAAARSAGLAVAGTGGRMPAAAYDTCARAARDAGHTAVTLHVGNGLESDDDAHRLFDAICAAQARHGIPLCVETHRATLTQDVWRTVHFVQRFPELLINADLSHWYTGAEMPYTGVETFMDYARPVCDRVRFVHGRIGTSGCIQVDIGEGDPAAFDDGLLAASSNHLADFATIWGHAFRGFKRSAGPGDVLPFAPELLRSGLHYARRTESGCEETDRWQQALVMVRFALRLFENT